MQSLEIILKFSRDRYLPDCLSCNCIQFLHHTKILPFSLCCSLHLMLQKHLSLELGGGQLGRWPKPPAFQYLGTFQTSSDTALLGRLHTESQTSYFSLILLGYTNLTRLRTQLPKYCIKDHHK